MRWDCYYIEYKSNFIKKNRIMKFYKTNLVAFY